MTFTHIYTESCLLLYGMKSVRVIECCSNMGDVGVVHAWVEINQQFEKPGGLTQEWHAGMIRVHGNTYGNTWQHMATCITL